MKSKIIIILLSILVVWYYFQFVKQVKVTNTKILKVERINFGFRITLMESAKYLKEIKLRKIDATTLELEVYTTTILNPFSSKQSYQDIEIEDGINTVIIAGLKLKTK